MAGAVPSKVVPGQTITLSYKAVAGAVGHSVHLGWDPSPGSGPTSGSELSVRWPRRRCSHCGQKGHRRDQCETSPKALAEAAGGGGGTALRVGRCVICRERMHPSKGCPEHGPTRAVERLADRFAALRVLKDDVLVLTVPKDSASAEAVKAATERVAWVAVRKGVPYIVLPEGWVLSVLRRDVSERILRSSLVKTNRQAGRFADLQVES